MTTHMTATRDKWLEARLDLLAAEKDLTRRSDDVARLRQRLPWVADRQDLHVRHRGGQQDAEGPVRWALAASRLSLHVRARLQGRLPVLLDDRRRLQWLCRPPCQSRCHADGGVAGAAGQAQGLQAAHGLDVSLGVVASAATSISTSTSRFTEAQQHESGIEYNYARGTHAMDARQRFPRSSCSAAWPAPTRRPICASGRA